MEKKNTAVGLQNSYIVHKKGLFLNSPTHRRPSHRFVMAHKTYAVLGAAYLWPWNVMLAAGPLVSRQLEGYPSLQATYSSSVMTTNTVVNLGVTIYLALRPADFSRRVVNGLLLLGVAFALLAASCVMELTPPVRYVTVLGLVALNSVGVSAVQNGAIAIAQRASEGGYMRSLLIGQSIAGVLPPILSLVVGSTTVSVTFSGLLFLSATILALLAIYLFRHETMAEHINLAENESLKMPPLETIKQISADLYYPATALILGFGVTLAYPVFANGVASHNLPLTIFAPVTHLVWNLGDLAGRVACQYNPNLAVQGRRNLVRYAVIRVVFVVMLALLARANNPSDLVYEVVQFTFGLTSGHLIASALSLAPSCVEESLRPAAGGLIGLFIGVGLIFGALASFLVVPLV